MTAKEEKFVNEYVKDFNGTKAAIRAGYSKNSARQIASDTLSKPYIKEKLQNILNESTLDKDSVKKIITDIATANISNYFKSVKVIRHTKIKKGLQILIEDLRAKMEFEDSYALQVNLKDKELTAHMKEQEYKRRQIIRYKLELENNPNAFRIVDSDPELVDDVEIDLVALAADKEGGRIKSFKNGKYGVEVELLQADNALVSMARIHSLFIDKSEIDHTTNGESINEKPDFSKLSREEKLTLLDLHKKTKSAK